MKTNIQKTILKITFTILLITLTLTISKLSLAAYTPIVGGVGYSLIASGETISGVDT